MILVLVCKRECCAAVCLASIAPISDSSISSRRGPNWTSRHGNSFSLLPWKHQLSCSGEPVTPSMALMIASPKINHSWRPECQSKVSQQWATSHDSSLHRPSLISWKLYPAANSNSILTYGSSETRGNTREGSNRR